MSWLDYLVMPMTIFVTLWTCLGLLFPTLSQATGSGVWGAVVYLCLSLAAVVFNWIQVALLALQALSPERPISKRRVYLLRVLDTYVSTTIAFGAVFTAIALIDQSQFFAATSSSGIPVSNAWRLTLNFVMATVLLIGGVGFGPYVAAETGALIVVGACNLTGWFYTLVSGALIVSVAVQDYKDRGGIYTASPLATSRNQ